jgi:hypothetical protein
MSAFFDCCVLSRRILCDEAIIRPKESYRLWCDLETSTIRRPWPALGCCAKGGRSGCNLICRIIPTLASVD